MERSPARFIAKTPIPWIVWVTAVKDKIALASVAPYCLNLKLVMITKGMGKNKRGKASEKAILPET